MHCIALQRRLLPCYQSQGNENLNTLLFIHSVEIEPTTIASTVASVCHCTITESITVTYYITKKNICKVITSCIIQSIQSRMLLTICWVVHSQYRVSGLSPLCYWGLQQDWGIHIYIFCLRMMPVFNWFQRKNNYNDIKFITLIL